MSRSRKITLGIIGVLVALILAIYFGGVCYFQTHFLPGTVLNGMKCSFKTEAQVQKMISDTVSTYSLTIHEMNGGREVLKAKDMGLTYVEDDSVANLLAGQDSKMWFFSMVGGKEYETAAATTYDEAKLAEAVDALDCFENVTKPRDAYIEVKDGTFYVVNEVEGNALKEAKVARVINEAVKKGRRKVNLVKADCYKKPKVYRDDKALNKDVEELNAYTQVTIYYDFGDREEVVDAELIRSWLVKGEDGSYHLDETAMEDYVYQLAYKYDTFGGTRKFITALGEEITIKGGDYGYVIKQNETLRELKEAIMNGESGTREPVYLYEGVCRDTNDIGLTYVEIDLSAQMMYFYKEGSLLVETPVVTGTPSEGNATPTGCYALDNKKSPAVLKGEDYASDVTYWMPFNRNVGIHDCGTWRTEFGGDIYLTNGSHGCVNTPYDAAETIYNNIEIGMPIIVY